MHRRLGTKALTGDCVGRLDGGGVGLCVRASHSVPVKRRIRRGSSCQEIKRRQGIVLFFTEVTYFSKGALSSPRAMRLALGMVMRRVGRVFQN